MVQPLCVGRDDAAGFGWRDPFWPVVQERLRIRVVMITMISWRTWRIVGAQAIPHYDDLHSADGARGAPASAPTQDTGRIHGETPWGSLGVFVNHWLRRVHVVVTVKPAPRHVASPVQPPARAPASASFHDATGAITTFSRRAPFERHAAGLAAS